MNPHIQQLREKIEPIRNEIIHHPVYSVIKDKEDMKIFMQFHIYAVWDFMSLLKGLQNNLTCTTIPWFPKGSADTRFLINEIVVGEESDLDMNGIRKSHFELYLDAMQQCGADTNEIHTFLSFINQGNSVQDSLKNSDLPYEVQEFVGFTFDIINEGKDHVMASVFTFGREDLIPGMFMSIINDLDKTFPGEISVFKYYLERHIEVDGDHHGNLALEMTSMLCGDKKENWQEAEKAVLTSLQKRKLLWDGVYRCILERQDLLAES